MSDPVFFKTTEQKSIKKEGYNGYNSGKYLTNAQKEDTSNLSLDTHPPEE